MAGLQRHFDDQIYNYGDQVIVNLVSLSDSVDTFLTLLLLRKFHLIMISKFLSIKQPKLIEMLTVFYN